MNLVYNALLSICPLYNEYQQIKSFNLVGLFKHVGFSDLADGFSVPVLTNPSLKWAL